MSQKGEAPASSCRQTGCLPTRRRADNADRVIGRARQNTGKRATLKPDRTSRQVSAVRKKANSKFVWKLVLSFNPPACPYLKNAHIGGSSCYPQIHQHDHICGMPILVEARATLKSTSMPTKRFSSASYRKRLNTLMVQPNISGRMRKTGYSGETKPSNDELALGPVKLSSAALAVKALAGSVKWSPSP